MMCSAAATCNMHRPCLSAIDIAWCLHRGLESVSQSYNSTPFYHHLFLKPVSLFEAPDSNKFNIRRQTHIPYHPKERGFRFRFRHLEEEKKKENVRGRINLGEDRDHMNHIPSMKFLPGCPLSHLWVSSLSSLVLHKEGGREGGAVCTWLSIKQHLPGSCSSLLAREMIAGSFWSTKARWWPWQDNVESE